MSRYFRLTVALLVAVAFQGMVYGAEYFVAKQGRDANNGQTKETAFLTIQKGVNALAPGDTLTIGPGEYFEQVQLSIFGDLNRETIIRAEFPGTVVLRGDRDVDLKFEPVAGLRFVYAADCEPTALSVQETDTLTNVAPASESFALQFGPGRFFYDADAKKLYVSSSDFQSPEEHHYTIGTTKGHGFHMFKCRRVTLDGLAASSYRTAVQSEVLLLPISGFMLHETQQCIVRNCTAYYNGSGITINSGIGSNINQPGEGRANIVEHCVAYANRLDGVVAYNPSGETIRNCRSFLNQTYGARFYGGRAGDALCLMKEVIAWGNPGGDYWTKGQGLSGSFEEVIAEQCVAFRGCMFGNFRHGLIGGGAQRDGDKGTTVTAPDSHSEFHRFLDENFADPLNYDFRYQQDSSLAAAGRGAEYTGLYAYTPNIYYVKPDGNDGGDGRSMDKAWKTPSVAAGKLKAGDTLYIAPGAYQGGLTLSARDVRIRGRGLEPAVIAGEIGLTDCADVSLERLQFTDSVSVSNGENIELTNCAFAGPVEASQVRLLRATHNIALAEVTLDGCSNIFLSGNVYGAAPAVSVTSLEAVAYSGYNSYPDAAQCWTAAGQKVSLEDLHPRFDVQSMVAVPHTQRDGYAVARATASECRGRGPLSTNIGPYREWAPKQLQLMGPYAESKSAESADIEWWTTLPVQVELRWGDTPQCANRKAFTQNSFYSYGLTGLQPDKTYYARVVPANIDVAADPARRFQIPQQMQAAPAEFKTNAEVVPVATYYVSPTGNNDADGLSLQTAWKSIQAAADRARPGDTVLLATGIYPGTFYFRTSGLPDKPITFKSAPGQKANIHGMDEKLHVGFVLYGKHHYRLDSLYFTGFAGIEDNVGGKESGAIVPRDCIDLQITRCNIGQGWGRCLEPHDCTDLLVRNCVFMSSMEAVMVYNCPGLVIENSVFISPLILHLHVYGGQEKPAIVRRNIFGENTRHKVHICPVSVDGTMAENCYYMRWSQYDRLLANNMMFPQLQQSRGANDSLYVNPYMPGAQGWRQGWQSISNDYQSQNPYESIEFNRLFPTNPEIILRDIGLQPQEFSDCHFWKDWPYDKEWAATVKAGMDAAQAQREAGQYAQASTAYSQLAAKMQMSERLKAEVLDRAAQCSELAKDYQRAGTIAQSIPLKPFSVRRVMAILIEQKRYADLVKAFSDEAMGGAPTAWICPETEMVMADAYYYRGIAHAETGNLQAAETDFRTMVDKGGPLGYSPGPTVLAVSWKRLGDYYHTYGKNNAKALDAYREALKTEVNPEIKDELAAATRAIAEISQKTR